MKITSNTTSTIKLDIMFYKIAQYKDMISSKEMLSKIKGPYWILQVHTNGTLILQHNAHLIDCVNIQHLHPAFW
jgi:hypothetical protein